MMTTTITAIAAMTVVLYAVPLEGAEVVVEADAVDDAVCDTVVAVTGVVVGDAAVVVAFTVVPLAGPVTVRTKVAGLLDGSSPVAVNAILYAPGNVVAKVFTMAVPE